MSNIPIKDKNDKQLMSDEEQNSIWIEHFRDILNQPDPPQTYNFDDEREAIGAVDELDVNTGVAHSGCSLRNTAAAFAIRVRMSMSASPSYDTMLPR
ncbi:hypothetical protein Y032_0012g1909 [Ancylostoma ceylanicum]|nr:hypothetical protein Y032_0012g1909 [Ancylostoma ceylanicum]